jgi:3'(2'), 5'-bisphosphate nucleotidase
VPRLDDQQLAIETARSTGARLLQMQVADLPRSPDELGRLGDSSAHRWITAQLSEQRPADVIFSEEAPDDGSRLTASRVWLVDPLDGTRDFSRRKGDWAVQIALWTRAARDISAAAVVIPVRGIELSGNALLSKDTGRYQGPANSPPRLVTSRTRASGRVLALAARTGSQIIGAGSVGVKVALVIRGEADAYAHAGGMHDWDSAAPLAVARAAGLHVSRFDGSPVIFNTPAAITDEVLVCRPELAGAFLAAWPETGPE